MSVLQATFAATLVDEWVRAGVSDAVVCPGSRSTPLALALASRPELAVHVRLDERSAGFFALGIALATRRPVVVCVTSGTAAAELHAAVVEAHHARVPLIVCTADRPPELQGVGASQTIRQHGIYPHVLRWEADPGVPAPETVGAWRSLGARCALEAVEGPCGPGPVHLNLAFRDPLVGEPGTLPPGRAGGEPWHRVHPPLRSTERAGTWAVPLEGRGVVVAGAHCGDPDVVLDFARRLGWPLLADPRSGCRRAHPQVVAAADALARATPDSLRPDVVVRIGEPWVSMALPAYLKGARVLALDPWWRWQDPGRDADVVVRADPVSWLSGARGEPATPSWLERWQRAEGAAQSAIDAALAAESLCEPLCEPLVARRLYEALSEATTVMVSSSMPVRDLEWFAPAVASPPMVLSNRGANGIDGVCSSALGAARSGCGPVVCLVGDLAFLHDLTSLVTSAGDEGGANCTFVVVDNAGGGIFELLAQAEATERTVFDRLFGTPQRVDVLEAARGLGATCTDVGTIDQLLGGVRAGVASAGLTVVRVRVPPRPANAAVHSRIHRKVTQAVTDALDARD